MAEDFNNMDYTEINSLLSRMANLLRTGDFQQADECCTYVLHLLPGYGPAYLGKLLAEFGLRQPEDLLYTDENYSGSENYRLAVARSDEDMKRFLIAAPYENYYLRAEKLMKEAEGETDLKNASKMFDQIPDYRNSRELSRQCLEKVEEKRQEELYQRADQLMKTASDERSWQAAADSFSLLNGYRDSAEKRSTCLRKAETIRKDAVYNSAADPLSCKDIRLLQDALTKYESIPGWRDAGEKATLCRNRISDLEKVSKTKRTRIFFITAAALFCTAVACGMIFGIVPLANYNRANGLMREGAYAEASEAFYSLNGFLDSETKARECELAVTEAQYQNAVTLLNEGQYAEAAEAFQALNGYKDSTEKISEALRLTTDGQYELVVRYVENGNYMEAVRILKALGDYRESLSLLDKAYSGVSVTLARSDVSSAVNELESMDADTAAEIIARMDPVSASRVVISSARPGMIVRFGKYEQDNDPENGKEPIEWLVLDRGVDSLLLISRYALDVRPYHAEPKEIIWEDSDLRQWLNSVFYQNAFSSAEKELIRMAMNDNPGLPEETAPAGRVTEDHVFLLSVNEAERFFASDGSRIAEPTDYALGLEPEVIGSGAAWWLRSPGYDGHNAAYVFSDGTIHRNGIYVFSSQDCVRPVIEISF